MKYFSLFFLFALICICFAQIEGASRVRREDDTLEQIQKSLSETFESFKKAAEDVASKMDLKQLQQDFSSKIEQLSKTFTDSGSPSDAQDVQQQQTP